MTGLQQTLIISRNIGDLVTYNELVVPNSLPHPLHIANSSRNIANSNCIDFWVRIRSIERIGKYELRISNQNALNLSGARRITAIFFP